MNKRYFMFILLYIAITNATYLFAKEAPYTYFYIDGCTDCIYVESLIDELSISVEKINLANEYEFFQETADRYNVPANKRHAPIIFKNDGYLDSSSITKDSLLREGLSISTTNNNQNSFSLQLFILGFLAGINPCSISFILFLFTSLSLDSFKILKVGFFYILGKVFVYISLGILFINAFEKAQLFLIPIAGYLKWIAFLIAIGFGVFYLLDSLSTLNQRYDKVKMQLPTVFRKANHLIIKKFADNKNLSIIAILSLSIVISIIEFMCTGQSFVLSIGFMHPGSINLLVLDFSFFLVGMITPLIFVIIILALGKSTQVIGNCIYKLLPIIKFLTAIVFIIFAFSILKGVDIIV